MKSPRSLSFTALLAAALLAAPSALADLILTPGNINLSPTASPTPLFLAGTWTRTLNSDGSATYTNANGGTLILSSSVVYSGAIVVSSNGVSNTVAPGNSVTGQTITVSGGGLHVINGTLIADTITINPGNVFGGSGSIRGNAIFLSGSVLAPGNSPGIQTQASGNATLAGGTTFIAELGSTTAGNGNGFHDQYFVQAGSLSLDAAAGGVLLDVKSWLTADGVTAFTAARRDVFSILRASNGITGTFNDITTGTAITQVGQSNFTTWMLYDNQVSAHTSGKLYGTGLLGDQTFAAYATAPSQSSILTSIWNQSVTASASSTNANPAGFINSDTLAGKVAVVVLTSDNLNRDLALMSPEAYLAVSDFGLTVGRDLLGQALDSASLWREGNWTVGAGYSRSQHDYVGGSDAVSNYRLQANSSIVSLRYQLAPTWQVGAFFGYTDGQTNATDGSSEVRGSTFGLLADGSKSLAGRDFALRAAISFGDFTYDMSRSGSKATDKKMKTVSAELSASTDVYKSEKLSFGPAVGVAYGRAKTSSFDEVGGTLPLSVAGGSSESVVTTAGLQLTYQVTTAAVVTVKAGWEHEFADAADVGANFSGGTGSGFSASASQSRNTAVGGIDLGVRLPSAFTLHLTGEVRDNRQFNCNVVLGAAINRRF
jgi:uncharacterized protein with beta-barrel porin domain